MTAGEIDGVRARSARLPRHARRAQLLESALEVFATQGYHAAAMDDIAAKAGVSKPVLYQHFPGKFELYLALLESACDTVIENTRAALRATQDNKLRVAGTMAAFYDYVTADTGAFRLVFESDVTSEPQVRAQVERVTTECAEAITEVIAEDTGLSTEAAHLLAVGLVGMGQVSARYWLNDPGSLSREDATALISGLAWRGIRGYPLH
jgi:AcrR family transcriptional regulator